MPQSQPLRRIGAEMSEIRYVIGDATRPEGDGRKAIIHVVNDEGRWGSGFVLALSARWEKPERLYRQWHRSGQLSLGKVQLVVVEPVVCVANMCAQVMGYRDGKPPIRWDALEICLSKVAAWATREKASVHGPRFAAGLAGGTWDEVEPIILRTLCAAGVPVTIYDFLGA